MAAVASIASSPKSKSRRSCRPVGGRVGRSRGTTLDGAVVVTFTVAVAAFVPSGVTDVGEKVQVARDGAPVQLSETAWLKPPAGVTLSV